MNPRSAYTSIKSKKSLITLTLLLFFVFQVLLLIASKRDFKIPNTFIKFLSAVYLDSDSTIEVDNLYYSFPNKFWIKDLEFKKSKAFTIYSSNIEISLDLYRLINKSIKSIARVNFKEASFVSYKGNRISLKNFLYKCTETSIALDTEIRSDSVKIQLLGLLETDKIIDKIDTILNTFPDFDADQKQKHGFPNMIYDSNASLNLYSLVFLGDNLEINISQDGSAGNIASDANAFVEVQSKDKQHKFPAYSHAHN